MVCPLTPAASRPDRSGQCRGLAIGGAYGGYAGMAGDWAKTEGCKDCSLAWSAANSAEANADLAKGDGIGTAAYWFMGGPGVDPHYNGTTAEASAWGAAQAADTIAAVKASGAVKYPASGERERSSFPQR